jgi:hypothetical protein
MCVHAYIVKYACVYGSCQTTVEEHTYVSMYVVMCQHRTRSDPIVRPQRRNTYVCSYMYSVVGPNRGAYMRAHVCIVKYTCFYGSRRTTVEEHTYVSIYVLKSGDVSW